MEAVAWTTIALLAASQGVVVFMLWRERDREDRLDARFNQVDARFNQVHSQFIQLDKKIDTRYRELEAKFGARFGHLEEKIERLDTKVDSRYEALDSKLEGMSARLADVQAKAHFHPQAS